MQSKDKTRVFQLARDLDLSTKDVLTICKELGIDANNQLSSLTPEQCTQVTEYTRSKANGSSSVTTAASGTHVAPRPKTDPLQNRVQTLPQARVKATPPPPEPTKPTAAPAAHVAAAVPEPIAAIEAVSVTSAPVVETTPQPPVAATVVTTPPVQSANIETPAVPDHSPSETAKEPPPPVVEAPVVPTNVSVGTDVSSGDANPVPTLVAKRVEESKTRKPASEPVELPPAEPAPVVQPETPAVVNPPPEQLNAAVAPQAAVNPPPASPPAAPASPPRPTASPLQPIRNLSSRPPVIPIAGKGSVPNLRPAAANKATSVPTNKPADPVKPPETVKPTEVTATPEPSRPTSSTKPTEPSRSTPVDPNRPGVRPTGQRDGARPQPDRTTDRPLGNKPANHGGTNRPQPPVAGNPGTGPKPNQPTRGDARNDRGSSANPTRSGTGKPSSTGTGPATPPRPNQPGVPRPTGPTVSPSSTAGNPASPKPANAPTGGVTARARLTPEQIQRIMRGESVQKTLGQKVVTPVAPPPVQPVAEFPSSEPDLAMDDEIEGRGAKPHGKGGVAGRDQRRSEREARAQNRKATPGTTNVVVRGGEVEVIEESRGTRIKKHRVKEKKPITVPRKGKVPIDLPITIRKLSEAIGVKVGTIIGKLVKQGASFTALTINSVLDPEDAELFAVEEGCELEIRKPADAEDDLLSKIRKDEDSPESRLPRAPVVTIMGHVDHGKTSLLDKIRKSNVAAGEAGGITQVIRAWRVEREGRPITFLDTPGHEAFTKMRARGAQVTDIAVIVVAADDGVMPQTEEAINHAKAAGVATIVAINKVDLPNANVKKTEQQLFSLSVLPDNMGGDTPFVYTSAATGKGIDDLLEAILLVAELRDLRANPNKPAIGTCLEAHMRGDEGVFATLLVQGGTLNKGDIILCGATFGRVRAMYDDLGRPIKQAGPSVPVRITGLDQVPSADDPFVVVDDLAQAREIAEKRRAKQNEANQSVRQPISLESLKTAKIAELKVILKADFRGSVEAITKELEKFQHEEVRVRVLHTGVGAITVSDVQLAMTSPTDTMIVGFNAVPDNDALAEAERHGISIREYNIIYNLVDDVKAALQGKLKPREEVIHLGRAVVRETFKISKVGTIAGCYVTQGTIERSAKVRVIREGVVIYPPAERTANLESLKRFKEDAREVREGFECGIKVGGYDDIKVGDVIEAYRVDQVQRTL